MQNSTYSKKKGGLVANNLCSFDAKIEHSNWRQFIVSMIRLFSCSLSRSEFLIRNSSMLVFVAVKSIAFLRMYENEHYGSKTNYNFQSGTAPSSIFSAWQRFWGKFIFIWFLLIAISSFCGNGWPFLVCSCTILTSAYHHAMPLSFIPPSKSQKFCLCQQIFYFWLFLSDQPT